MKLTRSRRSFERQASIPSGGTGEETAGSGRRRALCRLASEIARELALRNAARAVTDEAVQAVLIGRGYRRSEANRSIASVLSAGEWQDSGRRVRSRFRGAGSGKVVKVWTLRDLHAPGV